MDLDLEGTIHRLSLVASSDVLGERVTAVSL